MLYLDTHSVLSMFLIGSFRRGASRILPIMHSPSTLYYWVIYIYSVWFSEFPIHETFIEKNLTSKLLADSYLLVAYPYFCTQDLDSKKGSQMFIEDFWKLQSTAKWWAVSMSATARSSCRRGLLGDAVLTPHTNSHRLDVSYLSPYIWRWDLGFDVSSIGYHSLYVISLTFFSC